jgi:transcriptional regulator with XRE-family HTH domain
MRCEGATLASTTVGRSGDKDLLDKGLDIYRVAAMATDKAARGATAVNGSGATDAPSPVGERLRELRIGRRLTLKEVANEAGVTEGFLSQVERGRSSPSLKTLQALAGALGLTPGDIFDSSARELPHFVSRDKRGTIELGPISKYRVSPTSITRVEVIGGTFQPEATAGEAYTHGDSDEVCVVLSGNLIAEIDGTEFEMTAGDALSYRSSMLHTFRALDEPSEVLWVISPPSW